MLKGLSRSGLTVIMASHDLNLVTRYCDKVMLLSEGKIIKFGTPCEVVTKDSIRDVYGVDIKVIYDEGIPYIIPNAPGENENEFRVKL